MRDMETPVAVSDGLRTRRTLVAGIGNVSLADDGFGVEVARRLVLESLGDGVHVADFGIRGLHLAQEITSGKYDDVILVDAVCRGGPSGSLYAIEPDVTDVDAGEADAHTLTPGAVLALVRKISGTLPWVVIVGCEPAHLNDSMGLSPSVTTAVEGAMQIVRDLVAARAGG
jgi:hydrogenase maturation protease